MVVVRSGSTRLSQSWRFSSGLSNVYPCHGCGRVFFPGQISRSSLLNANAQWQENGSGERENHSGNDREGRDGRRRARLWGVAIGDLFRLAEPLSAVITVAGRLLILCATWFEADGLPHGIFNAHFGD